MIYYKIQDNFLVKEDIIENLKKIIKYFSILITISLLVTIFLYIRNNDFFISFINTLFTISFIISIIYGFQWIREKGFFNMIVYSKDRFKQSLRKTGGNFVGSISDFLSYMTPDVLKTDKEEKNSKSSKNDESVKVHNYLDYNEKIMWKNTSSILSASLLALLISFILSFLII